MEILKAVKRLFSEGLFLATVGTCGMISALAVIGNAHELKADQWASWVQAVGSVSALLIALGLADYQIKRQTFAERLREAKNDLRIANFAEAVIRESLDAVRDEEAAQSRWPDGTGYIFHNRSRIQAAQIMVRTLAAEPLFSELIEPVLNTHALLVDVEAASSQLAGQGTFSASSRFTLYWTTKNNAINTITSAASTAMAAAHQAVRSAEQRHSHLG